MNRFFQNRSMNKIYCIQCNQHRKLKKPKISYLFNKSRGVLNKYIMTLKNMVQKNTSQDLD